MIIGPSFLKNLSCFALTAVLALGNPPMAGSDSFPRQKKSDPSKTKKIWLIPDIHCDEKAQLAVGHMIKTLIRTNSSQKPLLILMEGADGIIATHFFETFPNKEIRRTQTLPWVKNGIISGPEFLKITEGRYFPIRLEGIENRRLYIRNFRQFRKAVQERRFLNPWFESFSKSLSILKEKIYSPAVKKLEKLSLALETSQISLSEYIHELDQFKSPILSSQPLPKKYSQISLFLKTINKEKFFSQARLNQEIQHLMIDISKSEPAKLKIFYKNLVLFRLGKISEQNYSLHLKKIYDQISKNQNNLYPMITESLEIMRLKNKLDADSLRKEIAAYSDMIKKNLLAGGSEEELYYLARDFDFLDKMTRLEADRETFEILQNNKKISPKNLASRIKILLKKAEITKKKYDEISSSASLHLAHLYVNSIAFYQTTVEREKSFAQNALRRMNRYGTDSAVIIAGGFHCSGLEKTFKAYSVETKTIVPRLPSLSNENHYFDLMMNPKFSRSMLSFPRLFSRLMTRLGPDFQSDVLYELLLSYVAALQKEIKDADMLKTAEEWLKNFERDMPKSFIDKGFFLIERLSKLPENPNGTSEKSSKSTAVLNYIHAHIIVLFQMRKDWDEIAAKEKLSSEPPNWFKYFSGDQEIYRLILPFAGKYAKFKEEMLFPENLDKDPLYILSKILREDRPLFAKILRMAGNEKFEAFYVIEQFPFLASILGDQLEDYHLLAELAEKIYTGDFVSSFTFQQMIAKPYFKKEDIKLAIELADRGLDPAPLFATIDEKFRVHRPADAEDIENLKIQFMDMLYRIHENIGSIEENQLVLESTLLSLFLADKAKVAKAFKLEGSQLELWQNFRILFPYTDILENHSFLEFLKYIPMAHLRRIFMIVLAPKLSAPSNYAGFIYLPMNLSELEEKGKPLDFADLTRELAQSLFEEMDLNRLTVWHDIQRMRDFVENPKTADPDDVEFTSFRDFSEIYIKWFSDPDELISRANRDTIFRVHLEMMAEYFILEDGENHKYLRFYVPQYAVDEDGEDVLIKQAIGIKTPYLGLTAVDIPVEHDSGPLWPVILGAYRELMGDTLDEDLEAAYQHFQAHGPRGDKNFSYASLDERTEIHADIDQAIQNGQAVAVQSSQLNKIFKVSDPEKLLKVFTQDIRQMPDSAQNKLLQYLSIPIHRSKLMKGLQILNNLLESANSLPDRRFMILTTDKGPFAEGKILAHAGYQEKTSGQPESGTIYLHLQTLLLALESVNMETALKELIKHENNDLIEKDHRLRPETENLSAIHHLWIALQKKIEQARFFSVAQSPAGVAFIAGSKAEFDEAA